MTKKTTRTTDKPAAPATAQKRLAQLAATPKVTLAGTIRKLLPDIEAAQAAGHSNQKIIEALGIETTAGAFKVTLARIRKEQQ